MHLEVAVPAPLPGTFTYEWDEEIIPGSRVIVPFGPRKLVGVVTGKTEKELAPKVKIKKIAELVDKAPVYSSVLLEIAQWMSRYYVHPLGEVLATMLPAGSSRLEKISYELTPAFLNLVADGPVSETDLLSDLFGKKKLLSGLTLRSKLKKRVQEGRLDESQLHEWITKGWVRIAKGKVIKTRKVASDGFYDSDDSRTPQTALPLTAAQQQVFAEIVKPEEREKPILLWGLTGSGKTELYLQTLAHAFGADDKSQALIMVPEISLTPQMTRVFDARFPGLVAVVHSGMTDAQRWAELERIRKGQARILIGPRSAVFGPFAQLKVLIVDEEHDPSYKQTTGLTYNGRDIAILRAKLEKAQVILGSATPSMESYANAQMGKYRLLRLSERVSGRPLPQIEILTADPREKSVVPVKIEKVGGIEQAKIPVHPDILEALRENFAAKKQSMVIVNRRGYAFYLFSIDSKQTVLCPQCSISLTVHGRSTQLRCHYCDYHTSVQKVVAERPNERFVAVGYGSQQAEDYLANAIPGAKVVRVDSDTTAKKDMLPNTLDAFGRGEIDILVGTQILAKGHDFANVTLIAILEVDQTLNLPDFRAGERTFQLIVQAAGRAGRDRFPGKVLIQTVRPDHPVVRAGAEQDFLAFAERELSFRQSIGFPPYSKLILLEFNSEKEELLESHVSRIDRWLDAWFAKEPQILSKLHVLGPSTPPIELIRGRHRRTILFSGVELGTMWGVIRELTEHFKPLPGDLRMRIDVDPQSLI